MRTRGNLIVMSYYSKLGHQHHDLISYSVTWFTSFRFPDLPKMGDGRSADSAIPSGGRDKWLIKVGGAASWHTRWVCMMNDAIQCCRPDTRVPCLSKFGTVNWYSHVFTNNIGVCLPTLPQSGVIESRVLTNSGTKWCHRTRCTYQQWHKWHGRTML